MLKRLALAMTRRYLPGHALIDIHDGSVIAGTLDVAVLHKVLQHNRMGHHLTRSQGRGSRVAKRAAIAEAHNKAIQEYYEDPQGEILGE